VRSFIISSISSSVNLGSHWRSVFKNSQNSFTESLPPALSNDYQRSMPLMISEYEMYLYITFHLEVINSVSSLSFGYRL